MERPVVVAIGAAKKFTVKRQMNRARGGRAVGCHSARFLLPFFGVTGRDSSSTGRDSSSHRTEHVGALLALKLSNCI